MKIIKKLQPPSRWRIPVIIAMGVFFGLGAYAFYISKAYSYLYDSPEACVNCHIMGTQYASWFHSSHREWATCNDCHVPHESKLKQYAFKAMDGLRHATIFTLRLEDQTLTIKDAGAAVVQRNCIRCHSDLNDRVGLNHVTLSMAHKGEGKLCWDCHRDIPHGTPRSTTSGANAIVPLPESPVPDWLNNLMKSSKNK